MQMKRNRERKYDQNISPVDWYLGSYLLRFVAIGEEGNDDPEERFLAWENTVIVKAKNLGEAYEKVECIGKEYTAPYEGGKGRGPVQWLFEGVTDLVPIYDKLEDGAEIAWTEYNYRKPKNLRKMVGRKGGFHQ